ncbi:hypothetical protein [Desulfobacula sp.]
MACVWTNPETQKALAIEPFIDFGDPGFLKDESDSVLLSQITNFIATIDVKELTKSYNWACSRWVPNLATQPCRWRDNWNTRLFI